MENVTFHWHTPRVHLLAVGQGCSWLTNLACAVHSHPKLSRIERITTQSPTRQRQHLSVLADTCLPVTFLNTKTIRRTTLAGCVGAERYVIQTDYAYITRNQSASIQTLSSHLKQTQRKAKAWQSIETTRWRRFNCNALKRSHRFIAHQNQRHFNNGRVWTRYVSQYQNQNIRTSTSHTCTMMAIRSESFAMFSLHFLQDARPLFAYSALYSLSSCESAIFVARLGEKNGKNSDCAANLPHCTTITM